MQFRQGDVFIESVTKIPNSAVEQPRTDGAPLIVEHGEATGHAHALHDPSVVMLHDPTTSERFLRVVRPSALTHEEHAPIELPAGKYRVRRQREYHPEEIRTVVD